MQKNTVFPRVLSALVAFVLLVSLSPALGAEGETTGHATYWRGSVFVEGHWTVFAQAGKSYEPINYNGNVYVPYFVAGEWTGSSAQWDPEGNQIRVHRQDHIPPYYRLSSELPSRTEAEIVAEREKFSAGLTTGFSVTVLTDTAVFGDAGAVTTTTQGATLYPLLYEDVPYLSLRTIAQLSDKTLCYFDRMYNQNVAQIYLYERPTQVQVDAALAYLDEVDIRIQAVSDACTALKRANTTQEELHDRLVELKNLLLDVREPSIPSNPTLAYMVTESLYATIDAQRGLASLTRDIGWAAQPITNLSKTVGNVRTRHANNVQSLATTLTNISMRMRQLVDAMAMGELR